MSETHDKDDRADDQSGDRSGDREDAGAMTPARRVGALGVIRLAAAGLMRSQIPRMAAALSYRTIFSIIPVMALGLLIFGSFVSEEDVDAGVRRVLEFAGVSQIAVATEGAENETSGAAAPGADPVDGPADGPADRSLEGAEPEGPPAPKKESRGIDADSGELDEVITDLINRVNRSIRDLPTGWIAIASVVVLIYAAMSMLIEIEKSFNQLCGAPSGRPWLRRLMLYWTMLTLGTLLLAATFLAGDALASWILSLSGEGGLIGATLAGLGVSILIATVLLFAFYITIPNTRIKLRPALAGAFIAAVLWELGKSLFTLYLREATGYTKFYGSLALLPLFMLWVYVTWIVVLFGMQAAHALQNFSGLIATSIAGADTERGATLLDPLVMVGAAVCAARAFAAGERVGADDVAEALGIEPALSARLLTTMAGRGLLMRVATGEDEDEAFTLARPASRITVDELLDAGHALDRFRAGPAGVIPEPLLGATRERARGLTLAELAARSGGELGAESAAHGRTEQGGAE